MEPLCLQRDVCGRMQDCESSQVRRRHSGQTPHVCHTLRYLRQGSRGHLPYRCTSQAEVAARGFACEAVLGVTLERRLLSSLALRARPFGNLHLLLSLSAPSPLPAKRFQLDTQVQHLKEHYLASSKQSTSPKPSRCNSRDPRSRP